MERYLQQIMFFYRALYNKNYKEAELCILSLVEKVLFINPLETKSIDDCTYMTNFIYTDFNSTYLDWIDSKDKDIEKEIQKQQSDAHHNYLIAHCFDPSSMDDLLWEVKQYLDNPSDNQKQEVHYQLACYKTMLTQ